jgi:hypothetical protein
MASDQGTTTTRLNLRTGPGTENPSLTVLPAGTPLSIIEERGDWLRVAAVGRDGFVHGSFVARETQAVPTGLNGASDDPLPGVSLTPPSSQLIKLGPRATAGEKTVATTWNSSGGVLSALATQMKFDTGAAVAVFCTESGGNCFQNGRMIIRFENHHFLRHWGKNHRPVFDAHFQFSAQKPWQAHMWRRSESDAFDMVHRDQNSEWNCFQFARTLDDTAAKMSISMGGPQILGSNYTEAGFESVDDMFDAFSSGEKRQIVAFFDFLQGVGTHPPKVLALQKLDFMRFAELYNGPGNAAVYSERLSMSYEAFQRLRPAVSAAVV